MMHQELSSKIAEAFATIASVLPEMDFISRQLYPVPRIQHTLATLYAHVIDFCITAVKWYQKATKGFLRKAFAAIKTPWPLEFEHIVRQIKETTTRLREQAAVAHQAETRHLALAISGQQVETRQIGLMVYEIKTEVMRLAKARSTQPPQTLLSSLLI